MFWCAVSGSSTIKVLPHPAPPLAARTVLPPLHHALDDGQAQPKPVGAQTVSAGACAYSLAMPRPQSVTAAVTSGAAAVMAPEICAYRVPAG